MDTIRFLEIEPTTRCNYTCPFCCGRALPQADLPLQTFEAALAAFPGVEHIELQGEGEPLLHPQFFEMAAIARSRGIRVSFITNGSLLDSSTVERILDVGFEKVLVSLESADVVTFKRLRGGDLLRVIEGLDRLNRRRRERGLDRPAIGLAVTVLRSTVSELSAIVDLYRRLGLDGGIATQPLNPMPSYTKCYPPGMANELLTAQELVAEIDELRADLVTRAAIDGISSARGFFDLLFDGFEVGERACPWLEKGAFVAADGAVTGCCTIKEAGAYSLGRVGCDSPETVLRARAEMARQLSEGLAPDACRGCEIAAMALSANTPTGGGTPERDAPPRMPNLEIEGETAPPLQPEMTLPSALADAREDPSSANRRPGRDDDPDKGLEHSGGPRQRADEREEQCARLRAALGAAQGEVAALHRSLSWRVTAPLRKCYELLGLHQR